MVWRLPAAVWPQPGAPSSSVAKALAIECVAK